LKAVQKENAIIYYWDYSNKKQYPAISKLKSYGLNVVGGPAIFDWSRHFPYYDFAEVNMIEMGKDGVDRGMMALITTRFGDFFSENLRENNYYGLAVNAQASWSPFLSDVRQIREAFAWNFYATEDMRVINCLDILSKQNALLPRFPNGMFNRFWMDPFVREIRPKEYQMAEQFITEAQQIFKIIHGIREQKVIKNNADNLDYLEFAADMALHYGVKILISEASYYSKLELAKIVEEKLKMPPGNPILEGFKWLKAHITQLMNRYEMLWLRLAVPQGLEHPMQRFRILDWHYVKAIEDLLKGTSPHAHQLESEWIWISGKRTHAHWGNHRWYYFVQTFDVQPKLKKAQVQGIAMSNLKLAINGQFVGEIFSRNAMSQKPMADGVQLFNVTDIIRESQNVICVDGINWAAGIGSINIALHLDYEDGSEQTIYSNPTWQYSPSKPENWPFETADMVEKHSLWLPVRSFGKSPGAWQGPITQPVWEKAWKSSISFVFGNRNFVESAMPVFIGRRLFKLLFWALPLGMRLMHVDNVGFRLK
jgi:hypothetical protein